MKFVIAWTTRSGGSAAETEAAVPRVLALLSNWAPPGDETFHQFLARADGNGGFAVIETDNLAGLALTHYKFAPYLDFSIYPVLEVQEATALFGEAIEFRKSIT